MSGPGRGPGSGAHCDLQWRVLAHEYGKSENQHKFQSALLSRSRLMTTENQQCLDDLQAAFIESMQHKSRNQAMDIDLSKESGLMAFTSTEDDNHSLVNAYLAKDSEFFSHSQLKSDCQTLAEILQLSEDIRIGLDAAMKSYIPAASTTPAGVQSTTTISRSSSTGILNERKTNDMAFDNSNKSFSTLKENDRNISYENQSYTFQLSRKQDDTKRSVDIYLNDDHEDDHQEKKVKKNPFSTAKDQYQLDVRKIIIWFNYFKIYY